MTLPIKRVCPHLPNPEHVRLRDEESERLPRVIMPSGVPAWALTRHEDIRAMLTDPRFSSDRTDPGFPTTVKNAQQSVGILKKMMISMDSPEHGPARRAVISEFTVKRMASLKPRIQQIVDEHIDAMLAGPRPVDLVQALSLPVPSLVICELLGVPYADHEFFQERTKVMVNRESSGERRRTAIQELASYLHDLVTEKERDEPDDLLGRQIRKQREDGEVDHEDLVSLAFLLLLAGHETTANMISLGTYSLLENPEQLASIKADPTKTPDAVEELLRYFTIVDFALSRVAREDAEIAGVKIKAGEGVVALSHTANHDPEVFDDPDTLNLERGARHHVAFGFGPHQCLGQNLARMELQIVFDTLFARIPGLKLAEPADKLPFKDDANIYGLYQLPVTW
ncbi:cytochrome P450 [Amycolatopsis pigmentata]|uniref:Cytochrome P450 n=1 Tax=Amycolatopsis pigmentata TaxID=450801 RepID=A0ABW5G2V4_9PSEU